MTTTRSYTLPPDAVEAAAEHAYYYIQCRPHYPWAAAKDVHGMYERGERTDHSRVVASDVDEARALATAAITAFIDHMVASGDAECTQHSMSRLAILMTLDGTKDTTP